MEEATMERFRQLLLDERAALEQVADTGSEAAATVELDQSRVGRLSRMDAMQGQAMSVEMNHRRREKLRRIAVALERIDNGDFGLCEDCGGAIAVGRLEFDPAASLCIDCANREDSA